MATGQRTVLQFAPSSTSAAKVQPLVIFNICDCYVRRPDQAERVIGTLLGSVLLDGTVDIRNSYVVPHNEFSDQVALDIEYHQTMLKSHLKVNPQEVIVGWFSTGLGVTGGSALIHEFYSREVSNPVHLTVDTGFKNGEVDILKTAMVDKLPGDLDGMEVLTERLVALINDVYKYVDDVVEGRVAPDNNIGRFLSDTVASLPKLSPPAVDKLINDNLQDQLLMLYLSSITRTQLSLAEKLNTAAQII
ncbi:eukaryotic translation initiation factor 3 subunit F-like isoform X2 [Mangifera indica]|uniref:eukaryotic translation initiation factor 3 subunit F-like isoform X2 n=1 Tax=Mangifera indica TaxID=29780 RepID=UPI001CF984B1|nr:eukaryotic translation initiation factor 3 subunit F-like isoform X2 [Mangifera indica]